MGLHPGAVFLYSATLALLSMGLTNPLYLLPLFIVALLVVASSGSMGRWKRTAAAFLPLVLLVAAANPLFSPYGEIVLWRGVDLPLIGRVRVTLEAVGYGATMGLKMAFLVTVFFLASVLADRDRSLSFLGRFFPRSSLTAILTVLLVPRMGADLRRISTAMRARGARFGGGARERVRARLPLLKVLLLSGLEGSWDLAEALHARGFGLGRRSRYPESGFRPRDAIVSAASLLSLLLFLLCLARGRGRYDFYSSSGGLFGWGDVAFLLGLCAALLSPAALKWGWVRWKFLRLKI